MGAKKRDKRTKVKPFIKVHSKRIDLVLDVDLRIHAQVLNYSHLFPTRYAFELEGLKGTVSSETFKEPSQREEAKKNIKKQLEERYKSGKNKWFFQPLRVRCLVARHRPALVLTDISFSNSSDCIFC